MPDPVTPNTTLAQTGIAPPDADMIITTTGAPTAEWVVNTEWQDMAPEGGPVNPAPAPATLPPFRTELAGLLRRHGRGEPLGMIVENLADLIDDYLNHLRLVRNRPHDEVAPPTGRRPDPILHVRPTPTNRGIDLPPMTREQMNIERIRLGLEPLPDYPTPAPITPPTGRRLTDGMTQVATGPWEAAQEQLERGNRAAQARQIERDAANLLAQANQLVAPTPQPPEDVAF